MLVGLTTIILSVGVYVAFSKKTAITNEIIIGTNDKTMFTLTSPEFEDGESIPSKFTCDGENIIPELHIKNAPEGTKTFVLVMDDPDIPDFVKEARGIDVFDHWVLYNIPGDTTVINSEKTIGNTGLNSKGDVTYTGPCPPDREHRYFFRLYALNGTLNFIKAPTLHEVEEAARSMMLEEVSLMGRYVRNTSN